jgi:hypothetical protein
MDCSRFATDETLGIETGQIIIERKKEVMQDLNQMLAMTGSNSKIE